MTRSFSSLGLIALTTFLGALGACSLADVPVAPLPPPDAGIAEAAAPPDPDAAADADASRPPPVFLDPSAWSDLLVVDAALPLGVTAKIRAQGPVVGARWGRHGGPAVTSGLYGSGDAGPSPEVVQWTLPAGATGDATKAVLAITLPGAVPASPYFGADGMVDLPFGGFSVFTYTAGGPPFPGEALLYGPSSYGTVASRAFSNGIYSAVGVATSGGGRVFFTALSPLAGAASGAADNGLYVADVCSGSLLPMGGCPASFKLFAWNGFSGPVAVDAAGDVFTAGSVVGGTTSDAVFGLSSTQALASTAQAATTLVAVDSGGTSSLAAIAPEGATPGWVLAKGYDGASAEPAFAQAFTGGASLATSGALVAKALQGGPQTTAFNMFTDAEGDLWIAAQTATDGWLLELRRKP